MSKPYRDGPHKEVSGANFYTRRNKMELCNCKLCYLCLNPPQTYDDYESFNLDRIGQEDRVYKGTHGMYDTKRLQKKYEP